MSLIAKNRLKSTWTPLNNQEANKTIFEERRKLIGIWFDKWSSDQRKVILEDVLARCKIKQLEYTADIVSKKVPVHHEDFTRTLPRVLSVYIFSYLDPRSLSRCSQVCWYWKNLTELDQLWLPKCVRLGWILNFTPSPYETGIWKRHYIENIKSLQYLRPKEPPKPPLTELEKMRLQVQADRESRKDLKTRKSKPLAPWKGSDPVPQDTWRYNYLQNEDEVEKVTRLRKKGLYGTEMDEVLRKSTTKLKTGSNINNTKRPVSAAKRLIAENKERPTWAKPRDGAPAVNLSNAGDLRTSLDASIRPTPVNKITTITTKPAKNRSARDPPSTALFPSNPWQIPNSDGYDSD